MPASDEQKMKARLLLQLRLDNTIGDGVNISYRLDSLTTVELAELDEILAEAEKLKFRAAVVNTDGVSVDPEVARNLLRQRLWILIGAQNNGGGIRIGRA